DLRVRHQCCILRKLKRDPGRFVDPRGNLARIFFSAFDSLFHFANREKIFIQLAPVAWTKCLNQVLRVGSNKVQNALAILQAPRPGLRIKTELLGSTEQALEGGARIHFRRHRSLWGAPRETVCVSATVTRITVTDGA